MGEVPIINKSLKLVEENAPKPETSLIDLLGDIGLEENKNIEKPPENVEEQKKSPDLVQGIYVYIYILRFITDWE